MQRQNLPHKNFLKVDPRQRRQIDQSKIAADKHAQLQVVVFTTGIKLSEFSCRLQFYQ